MEARISEASLSDAAEATQLLRKLGLVMPDDAQAHWRRMWLDNPALHEAASPPALGWTLRDEGGRMQGFFANIPLAYRLGGRQLLAGCASQWGVTKDWRAHVPELAARYFGQTGVDFLLVTTAIKPTGRIFEKHGGIRAPQPGLDQSRFLIADASGFLKAAMAKKDKPQILAPLLAPALAAASWLRQKLDDSQAAETFDLEAWADQVDALWRQKLTESPRLLALRSARALRWHYPKEKRACFIGVKRGGLLQGYAVLTADHAPAIGLKRWRLADMLALDDDPMIGACLLSEAFRQSVQAGVHVLEAASLPAPLDACLAASGAFTRQLPTWPAYYKPLASDLSLDDASRWYLTAYDGDATLV